MSLTMLKYGITTTFILIFTVLPSAISAAEVKALDKVIAIVDDDVILASELREKLTQIKKNLASRHIQMPGEEKLTREAFDQLVLEGIQLQLADRYGVRISDVQLDDTMHRIAADNGLNLEQFRAELEAQGQSFASVREGIRREMIIQSVQQGNVNRNIQITEQEIDNFLSTEKGEAMTQPEFHVLQALIEVSSEDSSKEREKKEEFVNDTLAAILAGKPFEEAILGLEPYSFTRSDLGWRKLSELPSLFTEIVSNMETGNVTKITSDAGFHLVYLAEEHGREQLIQQTKVRHILIKPTEILDNNQARNLAKSLRQQILDGEDFSTVAKKFSDDTGSAQEGGELDWISPGQMVPEFEAAVVNTEIGQLSKPIRSQFGWHVLEVMDRREQNMVDEVRRRQAAQHLHEKKYNEKLIAWLRQIREEAFVDVK